MIEWILMLIGWTTAEIGGMPEPLGAGGTTHEAAGELAPNG